MKRKQRHKNMASHEKKQKSAEHQRKGVLPAFFKIIAQKFTDANSQRRAEEIWSHKVESLQGW